LNKYCDVFFQTGRAVHLHICGQCSWSIDHNTERLRFHGHVVGGIALFYSQTISGRPQKTALLLFGLSPSTIYPHETIFDCHKALDLFMEETWTY